MALTGRAAALKRRIPKRATNDIGSPVATLFGMFSLFPERQNWPNELFVLTENIAGRETAINARLNSVEAPDIETA
jgi:hypothetical protein